jgi:3'-phosphoadenosine 5'-phosphosulfate sulfotransferase (PAPS reductase)/FAD synthetase
MNRHLPHDLKQMQSLPLESKILMTQRRIRDWYDHWDGDVYVSFSGGKDSTVLKHIVDNTPGVYDVPAVFVNTGLEYPEIQRFVFDVKDGKWDCFNPNVEIVIPEMRFDEVIKKYGYPAISKEISEVIYSARNSVPGKTKTVRIKRLNGELLDNNGNKSQFNCEKWKFMLDAPFEVANHCCAVMKKKPAKKYSKQTGRKPILATMAVESRLRYQLWIRNGCNAFDSKNPRSAPMSFWTEQDVLHYIKKFNVPYCPVYGDIIIKETNEEVLPGQVNMIDYMEEYEPQDILTTTGCNRTGCIFCMFGCHLEKEPNRFQMLKQTHPRQYEYCINGGEMVDGKWQPNKQGLGLGKVLDYIGVKYE